MRLRFLAILGLFSAISGGASASTSLVRCDYCTSAYQAEQFARNTYREELLVINPTQVNARWKFWVETQVIGKGCYIPRPDNGAAQGPEAPAAPTTAGTCQNVRIGVERPLNAAEQDLADKYRAAYVYSGGTMKAAEPINVPVSALNIPSTLYTGQLTAATLVNNSQVRDYYTRNLPTTMGQIQAIASNPVGAFLAVIQAAVTTTFAGADATQVTFSIRCGDGSVVEVVVSSSSRYASIQEARDSDGRTVMTRENQSYFGDFNQVYSSTQNMNTFLTNAANLGIPIVTGTLPTVTRVSCSWNPGSGTLTCIRPH
jgi:hypothetical protein